MIFGISETGERTHIDYANDDEIYTCPLCNTELVKKRGDIMRWHFAHKSLFDCDTWGEMSEWHIGWQEIFKPQHIEVPIIEKTKRHRADVKCGNVIIEFQHSSLAGRDFDERIEFYGRHGFLIWVFDLRDKDITERRSESFKWLYAYKFNGLEYKAWSSGFDMFFEIYDDYLIKVEWSSRWGWKYFGGKYYDVDEFKDHVTNRVKQNRKKIYLPNDFRESSV